MLNVVIIVIRPSIYTVTIFWETQSATSINSSAFIVNSIPLKKARGRYYYSLCYQANNICSVCLQISVMLGCRGGDRREGRKWEWWMGVGGGSELKNSVYLLKNCAKMNPSAV